MRRGLVVVGYLLGMTLIGFFVIPRLVSRKTTHGAASPTAVAELLTATPPASASASPKPSPTPSPSPSPFVLSTKPSPFGPNRLVIPTLGINSTWLPLGFLADGRTMDSPPGPSDLGWYTFTGAPGGPSNAVFAGHVDWYTGAPALFRGISSLTPGDAVEVSRADGRLVTYRVVSSQWFNYLQTSATPIIAATGVPTVTLITCGGTFDPSTHEYDMRLIVRAVADE